MDSASQSLTGTAYFDNFRVWDGIPEDFDNDLDVDNQDFSVWKGAYGTSGGADADGDLDSDGRDFLAWQRERGFVAPVSAAAVPEPAGAMLLALARGACLAAAGVPSGSRGSGASVVACSIACLPSRLDEDVDHLVLALQPARGDQRRRPPGRQLVPLPHVRA